MSQLLLCPLCQSPVESQDETCLNSGQYLEKPDAAKEDSLASVPPPEEAALAESTSEQRVEPDDRAEKLQEEEGASESPPTRKAREKKKDFSKKRLSKSDAQQERAEDRVFLAMLSKNFCPTCGCALEENDSPLWECAVCRESVSRAGAAEEERVFAEQISDFISAFDQDMDLAEPALAYLYRKQVEPALLEKYRNMVARWNEALKLGSVVIPEKNYSSLPNESVLLKTSRDAFSLTRLWNSPNVQHYVFLEESLREALN